MESFFFFFFLKQGGQEGRDRNKPFKSSLHEPCKDISDEQIRECLDFIAVVVLGVGAREVPKAGAGLPEGKTCLHKNPGTLVTLFIVLTICIAGG